MHEQVITFGTKTPPGERETLAETFYMQYPRIRGKRVLLCLSRLQEKKGCDILIEAFAKVASVDANHHLVMAGPNQDGLK